LAKDGWKKNESGWYNWENEPYDDSPIATVDFKKAATMYRRSHPVEVKVHKKLIRYFVSTKGTVLFKRGINNMGDPMNNHCEAATDLGQPLVTYFNKAFEAEDYKIDYNYYILEVLERIDNIEKTRKAQAFIESLSPTQQLKLF